MKQILKALLTCGALLTFAGCSSPAPAAKPAQSSAKPAETTTQTETTPADTTQKEETSTADAQITTSQPAPTLTIQDAGTAIANAFQDKGYNIFDVEQEYDEYSFDARSNLGSVEVSLEKYNTEAQARADFLNETSVDVDESLTPGDACVNDKGSLLVLYNNFNNYCEVEAVDAQNFITYSIDDIEQGSLDTVLSIMQSLGFAIK